MLRTRSAHVVGRYLWARTGVKLKPEYDRALKALETKSDPKPLIEFGERVVELIVPDGNTPPDWFWALGKTKRNSLNSLRKAIRVFKMNYEHQDLSNQILSDMALREAKDWGRAIRTLELATAAGDKEREIQHGPFLVIPVPGITKKQLDTSLSALDSAAAKIRLKFPKVLYGRVFLATSLSRKTAAHYVHTDDTVHLSVNARKRFDDIYTLIHELGHRFDYKFLESQLRNKFWGLSTKREHEVIHFDAKLRDQVADEVVDLAKTRALGHPLPKMSPELETWLRSVDGPLNIKRDMADYLAGKIDESKLHATAKGSKDADVMTDKVIREPLAVTPYGATNVRENFAEAFAHYVLGMDLAPEFVEILNDAR
jgi:hypothetical protein